MSFNSLEDLTGQIFGKVKVLRRGPDYDGFSDTRVQWYVMCLLCDQEQLVIARDLKRYRQRFKKGCYKCSTFRKTPKNRFKYGKNINGFTDKSVIILND